MKEKAEINLYINDEQAQASLAELKAELIQLKVLRDKAGAAGDIKGFNQLNGEMKKITKEARQMEKKVIDVKGVLNNLSGASIKELDSALRKANVELKVMKRSDGGWAAKKRDVQLLQAELDKATQKSKTYHSVMDRMAGGFNKYFAMGASVIASATGMVIGFKRIAEEVAKLDDVYSDVMKTTGRTRDEVLELNEVFKTMDTRTSREQLNMLARDAGKLGLTSKQDILDFVEAGNQINVALGEDLGADAIKQIGKMVERYRTATTEMKGLDLKGEMLAVGSAINELGASSTASEPYLVQFAGRLGGVAAQAKISMSAILGYGSALDQDMQAVEMSATALQNFIMKIMGDPAKFAKLAGLEVKGFTELLDKDANAAIKSVLRSLNEKGGFQQLIPIFQDMGLDGARAVGVLSAMAGSIDKIDEAQVIANKSMLEGVSITKEYDIKNNNLQAQLDKSRKAFREKALELGQHLTPALLFSTNSMSYMIKLIIRLIDFYQKYSRIIVTATAVIVTYTIAINAASIAFKAKYYWLVLAEKAQRLFNTAVKVNPYALAAAAIAGLITWVIMYNKKLNETTRAQKSFANITEKVNKDLDTQKSKVEILSNAVEDNNKALWFRKKAIDELKQIVPGYNASIDEEGKLVNNNTEAIKKYLVELEKEIKLKAAKEELEELYKNKRESERRLQSAQANEAQRKTQYGSSDYSGSESGIGGNVAKYTMLQRAVNDVTKSKNELAQVEHAISVIQQEITGTTISMSGEFSTLNNELDLTTTTIKKLGDSMGIDQAAFEKWKIQNQFYRDMMALLRYEAEATQKVIDRSDMRPDENVPDIDPETLHEASKLALKKQLADGVIDHETYYAVLENLEVAHLQAMITLKKQLGQSVNDEENALLDMKLDKQEQESEAQKEKIKIYTNAAIDAAQSVADTIFDIKRNAIRAELDEQLKALGEQQEAELKRKGLTEKQKDAINEKYRKKEAALKLDAWKKEQKASISQALINGALAITKTYAAYGFTPAGIAAMALQAIATGLQIAAIKKEKPPAFKHGGYTKSDLSDDEEAGVVHANEFVASAEAKRNPTVRPVLDAIDRAQRSGTIRSINLPAVMAVSHNAYKSGGYAPSGNTPSKAAEVAYPASNDNQALTSAMNRFADAVDKLQAEGISGKWVYQEFKEMAAKEESAIRRTA